MDTTPLHPAAPPPRQLFIDWLRIAALGLLMLYHVGMAYTTWPWHAKSAHAGTTLEPWMWLTGPWRMTLLFVISGAATGWMAARAEAAGRPHVTHGMEGARDARATPGTRGTRDTRGTRAFAAERARRLLLPLATGMVLVVPLQAWVEVRQFHGYAGNFVTFLPRYFAADGGFCSPGRGCLVLPTWNHLWFLPYLFVYTMAWLGLRHLAPAGEARAMARFAGALAGLRGHGVWAWPVLGFALTRWALAGRFPVTHALVDDPFAHLQFGGAFVLGLVLARAPALWSALQQRRCLTLALAVLAWGALWLLPPGAPRALAWSVAQGCGTCAALGFAHRYLQRDHRWRPALAAAVFPAYLLHQTFIVAGVPLLAPLALPAQAEAAALLTLTLAGTALGVVLLARVRLPGPLAAWFGLPAARRYLVPNRRSPASPSPGTM